MKISLPIILTVASVFCSTQPGLAQEVDFEVPTEINIVQGRLSVAFNDNVHEETARLLVTGLGYDIIESSFGPLYVWATLKSRLTPDQVRRFEADDRVESLSQTPIPEPVLTINDETFEKNHPDFSLAITFKSNVSQDEAANLLKDITGARISRTEKQPNEIVIDVGDQDAEAFSMLEGLDNVKWVTYIGMSGE